MRETIARFILYVINFIGLYLILCLMADKFVSNGSTGMLFKAYGTLCIVSPLTFLIAEGVMRLYKDKRVTTDDNE